MMLVMLQADKSVDSMLTHKLSEVNTQPTSSTTNVLNHSKGPHYSLIINLTLIMPPAFY